MSELNPKRPTILDNIASRCWRYPGLSNLLDQIDVATQVPAPKKSITIHFFEDGNDRIVLMAARVTLSLWPRGHRAKNGFEWTLTEPGQPMVNNTTDFFGACRAVSEFIKAVERQLNPPQAIDRPQIIDLLPGVVKVAPVYEDGTVGDYRDLPFLADGKITALQLRLKP